MGGKSSSSSSSSTQNYTTNNTANAGNLTSSFNFSNMLGSPTLNLGTINNDNATTQGVSGTTTGYAEPKNTSSTDSSSSAKAGGALEGLGSGLGLGIGGGMGAGGMVGGDEPLQYSTSGGSSMWNANPSATAPLSSTTIILFGGALMLIMLMSDSKKKKNKD